LTPVEVAQANVEKRVICFFQGVRGRPGQGFDKQRRVETNMREPGRMQMMANVGRVGWEVFGGLQRDHMAVWRAGMWSWDFGQTVFDGTPLSLPDAAPDTWHPAAPRSCPGCGAPLRDTGDCAYCATPAGGRLGHPKRSTYTYTQHAVCIPANTSFAVTLDVEDLAIIAPVYVRFTLFVTFRNVVEIG
jgi:hypothetical protein